jgi:MraZ protein
VQGVRGASSSQQVRDYQRMLASGASDETPDKQGRVTIPQHLRTYAGLERDCVVVGAINRVEIWDAAAWQAYEASKESAFADLDDEVFPGV